MVAEISKGDTMKSLTLICLVALLVAVCGCNKQTEKEQIEDISTFRCYENWTAKAVVVDVGPCLSGAGMYRLIVRVERDGTAELRAVLADSKLAVGQKVELVKVHNQSTNSAVEDFVVVRPTK
jgi:hypothetical protein